MISAISRQSCQMKSPHHAPPRWRNRQTHTPMLSSTYQGIRGQFLLHQSTNTLRHEPRHGKELLVCGRKQDIATSRPQINSLFKMASKLIKSCITSQQFIHLKVILVVHYCSGRSQHLLSSLDCLCRSFQLISQNITLASVLVVNLLVHERLTR
jgi:hypothetical protein